MLNSFPLADTFLGDLMILFNSKAWTEKQKGYKFKHLKIPHIFGIMAFFKVIPSTIL